MKKTLLWLDDIRNPFEFYETSDGVKGWLSYSPISHPFTVVWVKSYEEFVSFIEINGLPDAICFDHDLGISDTGKEKTGYDCAKWLVEYCLEHKKQLPLWNVQSANPVGKDNINGLLFNYEKHYA